MAATHNRAASPRPPPATARPPTRSDDSFDDRLHVTGDRSDTETRRTVYDAYRDWCNDNGHRPMATNKFWGRLVAVDPGIDPNGVKVGGTRYACGLQLDTDGDIVPVIAEVGQQWA